MSKIVNLEEYKGKRDNQQYESTYDRTLRNMTAEEYKMFWRLDINFQ